MPILQAPPAAVTIPNLTPSAVGVTSSGVGATLAANSYYPSLGLPPLGSCVALVTDSHGVRTIVPCSADTATGYTQSILGFLTSIGSSPIITTGRGSIISNPLVEDNLPMVPQQPVFLSYSPGRVTQTAPLMVGCVILRVGVALDSTTLILNTDLRVER